MSINDILGTQIEVGSTVITCHNNRIIVGRITELFEKSDNVKIEPLPFDTDGRRDIPRMKSFRRADYNVFVVSDQDLFIGTLKGYAHNTGYWEEDYDYEEE
jgi:hypothetical protein